MNYLLAKVYDIGFKNIGIEKLEIVAKIKKIKVSEIG